MDWNRVLETYDDGSEMRVKDVAQSMVVGVAVTAVLIGGIELYNHVKHKRRMKMLHEATERVTRLGL